jgi:hypothetical protein
MESIAKVYGVKLVLDVARFGDDPLWQNVSTLIVLITRCKVFRSLTE